MRSGGYFPVDLRALYDITGHPFDGTGQTLGFTLWTDPERQAAMTQFATDTGDQLITVDPSCMATGNSPTTPSSCSTQTVAADHLMTILENGNPDTTNNFGSNVETALDIEAAHGIATHAGLKYYASECSPNPPPNSGLANAGCNGTDVGMEMAMEDAANDPTLHSVSNSWAYGGEAEWGVTDPFMIATGNILAFAAAAGTTFYFSTGDSGTYESGYPSDSPYVVAVGGTSTYSTSNPGTHSTTTTWSGGGSWCSNIIGRPSWQTGAGVTANASCPGRVIPDVSAVADPNTGVRFTSSTNLTGGTSSGQVGGTSLAAPVMNGLQAVTQNFVNAQTYPGPTPHIGFVAPLLYQLGNGGHADSYYRDVQCGNTANPTSGPDGDAAGQGLGRRDRLGRARLVQLRHRPRHAARRDEPERACLPVAALRVELREDAQQLDRACLLLPDGVDLLRGRQCLGRNAVVRQVPVQRCVGRGEHVLQEHRRRPDLVPVEQRHVLDRLHEQRHLHEVGAGGRERRTTDGGRRGATSRPRPATTSRSPRSRARRARSATRSATGATR